MELSCFPLPYLTRNKFLIVLGLPVFGDSVLSICYRMEQTEFLGSRDQSDEFHVTTNSYYHNYLHSRFVSFSLGMY